MISEPPDVDEVENVFGECYNDIGIVADFLISTEYESIIMDSSRRTGAKKIDGYHHQSVELTLDKKTDDAVKHLLRNGYEVIVKRENTIQLIQWRWLNDVSCGIAYSINGHELPDVQYVTECTPMKEEGWYYYVSDYNQWRLKQ